MTQTSEKTYDLVLKQFVGNQLANVYFLLQDHILDRVLESADKIAEALYLKEGSPYKDLPTWLNYFPTESDVQLVVIEHGSYPWDLSAEVVQEREEARKKVARGDLVFEKKLHTSLIMMVAMARRAEPGVELSLSQEFQKACEVLEEYGVAKQHHRRAVRWNVPGMPSEATARHLRDQDPRMLEEVLNNKVPAMGRYCKDHSAVTGTTYETVSRLLDTTGCSKEEPYWIWSVLGQINTNRGVQIVCPGDWIVEPIEGLIQVLTHEQYQALYL